MIRKTFGAVAAMLLVGGLVAAGSSLASSATSGTAKAAAGAGAAQASIPTTGSYSGVDHAGRTITFSFSGNYMSHFMVNHTLIGGAHVSSGAWHETCHNGMCTKGSWVTDTHVTGFWRYGGGHWTAFDARTAPPVVPYPTTYMGSDHSGLRVHFSFHSGNLKNFSVDHNLVGDASVNSHGRFDTCHHSICYRGHWETDNIVVGTWRYSNSTHWNQWEAYAYAH